MSHFTTSNSPRTRAVEQLEVLEKLSGSAEIRVISRRVTDPCLERDIPGGCGYVPSRWVL